jgi:hypothetical protein
MHASKLKSTSEAKGVFRTPELLLKSVIAAQEQQRSQERLLNSKAANHALRKQGRDTDGARLLLTGVAKPI